MHRSYLLAMHASMSESNVIWLFRARISYSSYPARKTVSVLCSLTFSRVSWRIQHLPAVLIYPRESQQVPRYTVSVAWEAGAQASPTVSQRCWRTLRAGRSLFRRTGTESGGLGVWLCVRTSVSRLILLLKQMPLTQIQACHIMNKTKCAWKKFIIS